MKTAFKRSLLFFLMIFVLCSASSCDTRKYKLPVQELLITSQDKTHTVSAELAIKEEERAYGFMNRKNIPDGTGMLFVFEIDQVLSFWMKDTPTPLSIAYIDRNGTITDILDMTPFSLSSIKSSRSVRFALEVPQGWFKQNSIKKGDTVTLKDGTPLMSLVP